MRNIFFFPAFLLIVATVPIRSLLTAQQACQNACSLLERYQSNATLFASDGDAYTTQQEAHWKTAWKTPTCIYSPQSIDDVVHAIKILQSTKSKFAVRGGGHSPLSAWANIDNGVLISMRAISDKVYDPATETVRVGFGCTWMEVYQFVELHSRLVVGGRASTVGMGMIMGGGLSHLSNAYGFASDNVVSYELVLANATIVMASADSHQDLFYALKAGANNYGITTHVTLRTYPLSKAWGGTLVYTNEYRDQLMEALTIYQHSGQLDTKSALLAYLGINNNTAYVSLVYLDAVRRPQAFKPFYDIPSVVDTTRFYDKFGDILAEQVDRVVPRWTFGATTFFLDNETYVDAARISQIAAERLSTVNGGTMVLMPQPISKSMIKASRERGENPMIPQDREQMWFCINIGWNFKSDDEAVGSILMDTLDQIDGITKERNLYDPFIFLNDAYHSQNVFRSYGVETLNKMQAIGKRYDPEQMFQHQVPGGFKLYSANRRTP
ncbi:bifunctional solanapyrone synthase [Lindgomyces ingoldianus]|uniref:Bifunctional solanapyrone synthase n=1 Tax=Lindgomyces ingoldianus TaxID=673940 RepID=A0ACB6R3W8_9PLEO|nr:bifunctional solanapyrone synthase [Lindgomyces ingoldianus]KAF2473017.1 bifunctional solanapyrone synthase [Lindgomyces ingoldianus]